MIVVAIGDLKAERAGRNHRQGKKPICLVDGFSNAQQALKDLGRFL